MIETVAVFDLLLFGKTACSSANTRTFLNQKDNSHISLNLLLRSGAGTLLQESLCSVKKKNLFKHIPASFTINFLLFKTFREVELLVSVASFSSSSEVYPRVIFTCKMPSFQLYHQLLDFISW